MLSQNVQNIIAGAVEQDRDFPDVASLLIHAANECENEQDSETLKIIGGSLSMRYNADERKYISHIMWNNGQHPFSVENMDHNAREVLKNTIELLPSSWMRAQLSGILWLIEHSYQYGKTAVEDYLQQFEARFDALKWVRCFNIVQCAFNISREFGEKSEEFKKQLKLLI